MKDCRALALSTLDKKCRGGRDIERARASEREREREGEVERGGRERERERAFQEYGLGCQRPINPANMQSFLCAGAWPKTVLAYGLNRLHRWGCRGPYLPVCIANPEDLKCQIMSSQIRGANSN